MKDDAERITVAAAHGADAVTQVDAVAAPDAAHRATVDSENHRIAAPQRDHGGARLHARPLLGKHELAAREVLVRLAEQYRHLQREDVFAVKILVQAIIV